MKAPFIGINRIRISRDGDGVTTLVAFHGCPLSCQYCLNPHCKAPDGVRLTLTPEEVLDRVKIDDLYFQSTGGGICFGGGEPALFSDFIARFHEICPDSWRITVETSLNVPTRHIDALKPIVDQWIIDIKDMDPDIYLDYTGLNNIYVIRNLMKLSDAADRCIIRIPLIPKYNSQISQLASQKHLETFGYHNFDFFNYILPQQ